EKSYIRLRPSSRLHSFNPSPTTRNYMWCPIVGTSFYPLINHGIPNTPKLPESYSLPVMGGGPEFPLHDFQWVAGLSDNEFRTQAQRDHLRAAVDMGRQVLKHSPFIPF